MAYNSRETANAPSIVFPHCTMYQNRSRGVSPGPNRRPNTSRQPPSQQPSYYNPYPQPIPQRPSIYSYPPGGLQQQPLPPGNQPYPRAPYVQPPPPPVAPPGYLSGPLPFNVPNPPLPPGPLPPHAAYTHPLPPPPSLRHSALAPGGQYDKQINRSYREQHGANNQGFQNTNKSLKRPRLDDGQPHSNTRRPFRPNSSGNNNARNKQTLHHHHTHQQQQNQHVRTPRRSFADFRVYRVQIGTWDMTEPYDEAALRDSRVRISFRSAGDRDPPSHLSAMEAATHAPDRLTISIYRNTKRIVIPAEHINSVLINRGEGQIRVDTDGWGAFEEVLTASATDEATQSDPFNNKTEQGKTQWSLAKSDPTDGELAKAKIITIWINTDHPLPEPKWIGGNLESHVDRASRFGQILHIEDKDSKPTSWEGLLSSWVATSTCGTTSDRLQFFNTQLNQLSVLRRFLNRLLLSRQSSVVPCINQILKMVEDFGAKAGLTEADITAELQKACFNLPEWMVTKTLDLM